MLRDILIDNWREKKLLVSLLEPPIDTTMAATFDQYDKSRYVRENSHVLIHRASVMLALSIIGVMAFEIAIMQAT